MPVYAYINYKVLGSKHHCLLRTLLCWNCNKICRSINRSVFFFILTVLHSNRIPVMKADSASKGKKNTHKHTENQFYLIFRQHTYSIPLGSI